MGRGLTYADAVRVLGGSDRTVSALDRVTGGLLLAASAAGAGFALGLFDPAAHLARLSGALLDVVAGADLVQQQIGKQIDAAAVECGVGARSGGQPRHVTRRATNRGEEAFACTRVVVHMAARHWREKPHE